jgi:hypothetical protein
MTEHGVCELGGGMCVEFGVYLRARTLGAKSRLKDRGRDVFWDGAVLQLRNLAQLLRTMKIQWNDSGTFST